MELKFLIEPKNTITINPEGYIAICSLWTPPTFVYNLLEHKDSLLVSNSSPVAIIGGLFGGGLKIMLRNLLYNPQIEKIIIFGKDFSGAKEHLINFFSNEFKKLNEKRKYRFPNGEQKELGLISINGTNSNYITDDLVLPEFFNKIPMIQDVSEFPAFALHNIIHNSYKSESYTDSDRIAIDLPVPVITSFPSEIHSHQIIGNTILDCWKKLLYKITRFGKLVTFRDGKERYELLNTKVVITDPSNIVDSQLEYFNISNEEIEKYQRELLSAEFSKNQVSYTYGNRLRSYFGSDLLDLVAGDLSEDLDSRHNFITLWDNTNDLKSEECPCLVSLFFRKIDNKLDLTATFRSHNGIKAWPRNCFGLFRIMQEVCTLSGIGLQTGTLTIISNSMTIDPLNLDQVQSYIDNYKNEKYQMTLDPNGYLSINIDEMMSEIVIKHHSHNNELLGEYRGNNITNIYKKLYQEEVISDIGHALYIGSQLERARYCLLNNKKYIQDNSTVK